MLYAVVVHSYPPPKVATKENAAQVVAHNLSQQDAEAMELRLRSSADAGGGEFKMGVYLAEYEVPHTTPETDECDDCLEIVAAFHQKMMECDWIIAKQIFDHHHHHCY